MMLACQITDQGWIVVFTLVIAFTTVGYAIFTGLLWLQTKRSADATALLAQAAKDTAEAAIELNRPMLGISEVQWLASPAERDSNALIPAPHHLVVTLKNFGSLYAKRVAVSWKFYRQAPNDGRADGVQQPFDLARDASCPIDTCVRVEVQDVRPIVERRDHYKVSIQAEYSTPDEKRRWRYKAVRVFHFPNTFTMDDQIVDTTIEVGGS